MRKIAISDIHGCLQTFEALLDKVAFSKADMLYLMGDYVDRGPNSQGVIEAIWALQNEGYTVQCLRGNHEQLVSQAYRDVQCGYPPLHKDRALLRSYHVAHMGALPERHIQWMEGLPYYFEVEGYILVHAGLNFSKEDPFADKESMIWVRDWYDSLDRNWLGERVIVHGHTPQQQLVSQMQLAMLQNRPILNIDNGCVFGKTYGFGHLSAFDLTNCLLYHQDNVE